MQHYSFNIHPKKSISLNKNIIKQRKSNNNTRLFLFNEISETNSNFHSSKKNTKKELKLPSMRNPINYINTRTSKIFPTSLNENFYRNTSENIKNSLKETISESFKDISRLSKNDKLISEYNKLNKNNEEENFIIKPTSKLKEYQRLVETSSLIKYQSKNISNDIKNNPFMRKIEDLNKINDFEIIFHNSIMENIKAVYAKTKKGFFKIEHTTKSKDALGTGYVCENHNNIFSVSDMIERMNPISTLKFSKLLKKDYKEFLGYENKIKKHRKKDDVLRKRLIKKYHRELCYENEFADKYNIKKNPGVKFIIDNEEEHKNKKKNENINKTHYY